MKIKIENLDEETTLEKFVEDWGLDINEINEELENRSYYSDDFVEIEKEDNITTIKILTNLWEVIDFVNDIYDNHYLFIVKDVYNGENDEDGELNYTQFSIENSTPETSDIVFQGGEYDQKSILNKKQLSKFYKQRDNGNIDWTDLLKYQQIWIVKKKDLISNGWGKTIESFDLYDWESYPPEIITDGLRESFFDNGNLSKSGEYKDGKRNGVWKEFNVDGNLISEICYLKGEKEGVSISYYKNGNKKEKSNFKRDKLDGKQIEWDENGNIKFENIFKDDVIIRYRGFENGQLKLEENYKDRRVISQKYCDENGNIKSENIYKDGVIITYRGFENGKLSCEGDVIESKLDGPFKSFYESGKVLNEGRHKKNKMDGEWKGYYESGKLRKIAVFKDDVVLSQQCLDENGNEIECE